MGDSFGAWLTQRMEWCGYDRPVDLYRATGVNPSLIGRWMRDEAVPGMANIQRIAPALKMSTQELAARAGHLDVDEPVEPQEPPRQHPLVAELARILAPDSPISDTERAALEKVLDGALTPYRRHLRRRRAG